jgi:hypothetical protein
MCSAVQPSWVLVFGAILSSNNSTTYNHFLLLCAAPSNAVLITISCCYVQRRPTVCVLHIYIRAFFKQ